MNRFVNKGAMDWKDKLEKNHGEIAEKDKVLVAFSGRIDSSLLAKISRDIFGRECTLHHLWTRRPCSGEGSWKTGEDRNCWAMIWKKPCTAEKIFLMSLSLLDSRMLH